LEQVKQTFESSLKEQSALLHQSQKELKSLMSRLNEQEQEHSERMVQMTQANQDLSYQVERARLVCGVLHDTNNKFIDLITKDKEQSEAFVKRFEEYLEGKVKSFDEVLDALCATTDELSTVSSKANANASEQDKLLKLHAHLLERLGHAVDSLEEEQPPLSANRNGFYAQPKEHLKTVAMPSEVLKVKA